MLQAILSVVGGGAIIFALQIEDDQAVLVAEAVRHDVTCSLAAVRFGEHHDVLVAMKADVAPEEAEDASRHAQDQAIRARLPAIDQPDLFALLPAGEFRAAVQRPSLKAEQRPSIADDAISQHRRSQAGDGSADHQPLIHESLSAGVWHGSE